MDWLTRNFLEQPLYVYLTLAFAEIALAAWWYETRRRKVLYLLAVPVLLAGGVFAVSRAVRTDREMILAAAREIAADVQAGRTDALDKHLTDDFTGVYRGMVYDKPGAMALALAERGRYRVKGIDVASAEVELFGREATMTVRTRMRLHSAELAAGVNVNVTFELEWLKSNGVWKIRRAGEPRTAPGFP